MKKTSLMTLTFILLFVLAACGNTPSPLDSRALVPEECQHIDNINDWQPVWCDDFEVDGAPDPTRWGFDLGGGGWGNRELQYYTDSLDNAFIEDGVLTIRALREDHQGYEFTSARLVTRQRGDWLYGRVQVKARVPEGRGTWPAIWMLPTDVLYGIWPNSGEIDIMEHVGYDPNVIHGTIHTAAFNHMINTQLGFSTDIPTATSEFHLYEMIWEPGRIELFIDGERFAFFGFNPELNLNNENYQAWPFDQRFHLILNLAIGGDWGGVRGVDREAFPNQMEIEFVRVFQRDKAGMDQSPPEQVTQLTERLSSPTHTRLHWAHAIDDVMVSHYEIFVDGEYYDQTSLNAKNIRGLTPNTRHVIEVVAVDFAGNRSEPRAIAINTPSMRTFSGQIEATSFDTRRGVTIEESQEGTFANHVNFTDNTDFITFDLHVEEAGTYRVHYRIASETGGDIRLFRGSVRTDTTTFETTGGASVWQTISTDTFTLPEGVFTFRIVAPRGSLNLHYLDIEKVE